MVRRTSSSVCADDEIMARIAATSPPNSHCSRSRLLGLPTSIALAKVGTDGRGSTRPVLRNLGTVSLIVVGAENLAIGAPSFHAITPAARLPKLPLGTEITGGCVHCSAAYA